MGLAEIGNKINHRIFPSPFTSTRAREVLIEGQTLTQAEQDKYIKGKINTAISVGSINFGTNYHHFQHLMRTEEMLLANPAQLEKDIVRDLIKALVRSSEDRKKYNL